MKCGECNCWNPNQYDTEVENKEHINHQRTMWNKVLGACEKDNAHYPMFDYEECPLKQHKATILSGKEKSWD